MSSSRRRKPPPMFREPAGSYAASWRCRWQRVRCALGFHVWWLGPADRDGLVDGVRYDQPDDPVPEWCGGGSPWCQARRLVPRDRWPMLGVRFHHWRWCRASWRWAKRQSK